MDRPVAGSAADLLLRSLCLCQHHSPHAGHVSAFRHIVGGSRRARGVGRLLIGLLYQSGRRIDQLRDDAISDVLCSGLCELAAMVEDRVTGFVGESGYLVVHWIHLVEAAWNLVRDRTLKAVDRTVAPLRTASLSNACPLAVDTEVGRFRRRDCWTSTRPAVVE